MENLTTEQKKEVLEWYRYFFQFIPCAGPVFDMPKWDIKVDSCGSFFFQFLRLEENKPQETVYPFRTVAILPCYWIFYELCMVSMHLQYNWPLKEVYKSFWDYLEGLKQFYAPHKFPENYDEDLDEKLKKVLSLDVPLCFGKPETIIELYMLWLTHMSTCQFLKIDIDDLKEIRKKIIENKPDFF